jgi:hypothetical protein
MQNKSLRLDYKETEFWLFSHEADMGNFYPVKLKKIRNTL